MLHSPHRAHVNMPPTRFRLVRNYLDKTVLILEFEVHVQALNRSLRQHLRDPIAFGIFFVQVNVRVPCRFSIDLNSRPGISAHREIFCEVIVDLAVGGDPGVQEAILETGHRIAGDAHVGVAPFYEIIIADIHPAGVSDFAVDDHYLPVIAIVKLRDQVYERPSRLGEFLHHHASFFHLVVVTWEDVDVSDILMYESDFHAFTCLFHQHFLNLLCTLVMAEIEILHVDILLRILQVFHEKFELPVP